jgi:hypothetical protein
MSVPSDEGRLADHSSLSMTDYLLGDTPISSTPPLPLLPKPAIGARAPAVVVSRAHRPMRPRAVRQWRYQWREDSGHMVLGLALAGSEYLLRVPRTCDFAISGDAARIGVRPHRPITPEALEHLLADQVLPRCLAHRGELVVHAGGIAFGHDIALFVGESGRGKSTLAGLFLRAGRTVLSDDCLMLRPTPAAVRVLPSYPSLRLRRDSIDALFPGAAASGDLPRYSDKRRLSVPDRSPQAAACRVAAVYFLGDPAAGHDDCMIEPLTPASACIRLMEQSFQLDVLDREAVRRLLGRAGEVVARVPSFALDFPRDFSRSAALVARIEQHFIGVASQSRPA